MELLSPHNNRHKDTAASTVSNTMSILSGDRHINNHHRSINISEHDEDLNGDDIISTTTTTLHMNITRTSRILNAVLSRVNKQRHACARDYT